MSRPSNEPESNVRCAPAPRAATACGGRRCETTDCFLACVAAKTRELGDPWRRVGGSVLSSPRSRRPVSPEPASRRPGGWPSF
ncbi:hypothetical protein [Allokutzneria oryzae]|uniref:4Fe-4S Wbl-type domain-containing protein n=1 Tax=Allokutzneria oryzae TaxID=1378989 RepID=A0ABV6A8E4_9PSEU